MRTRKNDRQAHFPTDSILSHEHILYIHHCHTPSAPLTLTVVFYTPPPPLTLTGVSYTLPHPPHSLVSRTHFPIPHTHWCLVHTSPTPHTHWCLVHTSPPLTLTGVSYTPPPPLTLTGVSYTPPPPLTLTGVSYTLRRSLLLRAKYLPSWLHLQRGRGQGTAGDSSVWTDTGHTTRWMNVCVRTHACVVTTGYSTYNTDVYAALT